jgi:ABC-type glycerol-3-phosphate transport system permease component
LAGAWCPSWRARSPSLTVAESRSDVTALYRFIDGWNEFLFALTFIRSSDKYPLTLGLFKYVSRYQVEWHQLLASGFLATVVVVVLFMFVQRHLTRGLIAGAER